MIDIIVLGTVVIGGSALLIKDRRDIKRFETLASQVNSTFDVFMDRHNISNLDVVLRDEDMSLLDPCFEGNKKKSVDIMIPLIKKNEISNFDFVVKKIHRHQITPIHKHEVSNVHVYVLSGKLVVNLYDDETCNCIKPIVLKKNESTTIPPGILHNLISKWGSKVIIVYIPSLVKGISQHEGQ